MEVRYCLPLACALSMTVTQSALAYVGPGAGITVIGSALALVAAVAFAIVGFLWYPLRKWSRRRKKVEKPKGEDGASEPIKNE